MDTPLDHLKLHDSEMPQYIADASAVDRDNARVGVLSTVEQCAVLVLKLPDLAKKRYAWLAAPLFVQANGSTNAIGEFDFA